MDHTIPAPLIYFTNEDTKNNFYFSTSCTFRILFHQIVTLVSRTVRIFFHLTVTLISWALLGYSFIRKLHQYLVHFRIDSHSIFTSAFCAVLESSFIGLLRQYLARSQDSLSSFRLSSISRTFRDLLLDCYVSILRTTFRILFHWIVTLRSRTLEFSLIRLLRQCLVHC